MSDDNWYTRRFLTPPDEGKEPEPQPEEEEASE